MQWFVKKDKGQSMTEYVVLIGAVVIGITIALVAFRSQIITAFSNIITAIQQAVQKPTGSSGW